MVRGVVGGEGAIEAGQRMRGRRDHDEWDAVKRQTGEALAGERVGDGDAEGADAIGKQAGAAAEASGIDAGTDGGEGVAEGADILQDAARVGDEGMAGGGENRTIAVSIEQLEAELMLEVEIVNLVYCLVGGRCCGAPTPALPTRGREKFEGGGRRKNGVGAKRGKSLLVLFFRKELLYF